jgi:hypothetical protein
MKKQDKLNSIIAEIKQLFERDEDIDKFCLEKYGKGLTVKNGYFEIRDIPIKEIPIAIISYESEEEKKRFLFSEYETILSVPFGILQNDTGKVQEELIALKELLKLAIKKNATLSGKATYCTAIRSRKMDVLSNPLYFMELGIYVNYTL